MRCVLEWDVSANLPDNTVKFFTGLSNLLFLKGISGMPFRVCLTSIYCEFVTLSEPTSSILHLPMNTRLQAVYKNMLFDYG